MPAWPGKNTPTECRHIARGPKKATATSIGESSRRAIRRSFRESTQTADRQADQRREKRQAQRQRNERAEIPAEFPAARDERREQQRILRTRCQLLRRHPSPVLLVGEEFRPQIPDRGGVPLAGRIRNAHLSQSSEDSQQRHEKNSRNDPARRRRLFV